MTPSADLTDPKLREMVRRIVQTVDPDRVILFGSRARGEARPDSDYDLLIVAPTTLPVTERTGPLHVTLSGLGVPKEVIWRTEDEIAKWRDARSHFLTTVVRTGRVVYERGA